MGCGAEGGGSGGHDHLPVSGGGPFSALTMQEGDVIDAPTVLSDALLDFDDPDVFASGEGLTLFMTVRRPQTGLSDIERADAVSVRKGFGDREPILAADQPWEGGSVSAPSVIPGNPWLMFYLGGGGVGYATSSDGHSWTKVPGPLLPGAGAPAAVRIGNRIRVYYVKDGSLWATEGPSPDQLGDLGQLVKPPSYGAAVGRAFARVANTPAGRVRHDLYFTVETAAGNADLGTAAPTTCGFAASYDGRSFDLATTPIVDVRVVSRALTMTPYQADGVDSALALWIEKRGGRDVVIAGKSP